MKYIYIYIYIYIYRERERERERESLYNNVNNSNVISVVKRNFLKLKIIKNYLKSIMFQEILILLYIEK